MSTIPAASAERAAELNQSLAEIRARVAASAGPAAPTLVAVSKYKPSADLLVCYDAGQRDFGENYVQELVDKAAELPLEIRWHFIGTLQSNKAKILAAIPNLHTIQTLTSAKAASGLSKALPLTRTAPLHVLLQVNTSGEESKSGLPPLARNSPPPRDAELLQLAAHVVNACPGLRLQGLMTIGALEQSLTAHETELNADFERLKETRDVLQEWLVSELGEAAREKWGDNGRLLLSMGMSSDFEAALKAGADIVRVGTGIFGARPKKT